VAPGAKWVQGAVDANRGNLGECLDEPWGRVSRQFRDPSSVAKASESITGNARVV
jgi:hypothetical protein